MPITAEKVRDVGLEHDAIERYLREEVVKVYDAVKAGRNEGKLLEQSKADVLAALRASRAKQNA